MESKKTLQELLSKRDYSGSNDDEYAQLLSTLIIHLGDEIYPLLEKATTENKKLSIKQSTNNSNILISEYTISDITLI